MFANPPRLNTVPAELIAGSKKRGIIKRESALNGTEVNSEFFKRFYGNDMKGQ